MKGLLYKDMIMTWKYCRMFMFLVVVFMVGSVFVTVNAFLTIYPIALASMLPFSVCAYEEKSRWNLFCDTLPVSRCKVVLSKYLYSLICISAVIVCSAVSISVKMSMHGGVDIDGLIKTLSIMLSVALLSPSLMLPFVFKYNVEKARVMYYISIGVVCGLSALVSNDSPILDIPMYIAPALAVVAFVASAVISVKIYKARDL